MKLFANLNFQNNRAENMRLQDGQPSSPASGHLFYNSLKKAIGLRTDTETVYLFPAKANLQTGTAISFGVNTIYGSKSAPETGSAISFTSTDYTPGVVCLLFHNSSNAPSFGGNFEIISGEYIPSQINVIYFHATPNNIVLTTISQLP